MPFLLQHTGQRVGVFATRAPVRLDVPGYTPGSGWLDQIRGGWYHQPDAAANPLIHPGPEGLRALGLDPPPPTGPPNGGG